MLSNSYLLEKVLSQSTSEVMLFFDNVDLVDFPYYLRGVVNIIGIDIVLKLSLVTSRIYIGKKGLDRFKLSNNFESRVILSSLHPSIKKELIKVFGGEKIELPTVDSIKKNTLFRVYKKKCLELHQNGEPVQDILRKIPLSKNKIVMIIEGRK